MATPAISPEDLLTALEAEWKRADKACDEFITTDPQLSRHRVRFKLKPECKATPEDKREIILLIRRMLTDGELPILHHVGEKLEKPLTYKRWAFRRQRAHLDPALAESRSTIINLDQAANKAHTDYHRHLMTLRAKSKIDRMEKDMTALVPAAYDAESCVIDQTIDSDNDTVQDTIPAHPANTWVEKSCATGRQTATARDSCFDR